MQLELDGWRRGFMFSACHLIPEHPKCGRLHGHTYTVNLRITGEVDESGMVIDFGKVKTALKEVLGELDHKIIVPGDANAFKMSKEEGTGSLRIEVGEKFYIFPEEDVFLMDVPAPTAEHMSSWILDRFIEKLGPNHNLSVIELGLDEGWGQGAWIQKKL
jgi:6-pyruvoyltetrahydropterin/6-carboxytetrahydropterin synthase